VSADAFAPENPLEEALALAAAQDDREGFLAVLAASDVWVPAPSDRAGEAFFLIAWSSGDLRFLPVFTSEARLAALAPQAEAWARVPMADLAGRLEDDTAIGVNPGGALGLLVPAGDVRGRPR
jgi:hypothetical protein